MARQLPRLLIALAAAAAIVLILLVPMAGAPRPPGTGELTLPTTLPANPARPAMTVINAGKLPEEKQFPAHNMIIRHRPWVEKDHRSELIVENYHIFNVTNQKAIDINLTSFDRPTPIADEPSTYSKVTVRNCEIHDVWRDEKGDKLGLHIDFLRICGGGARQPFEADVLVEDVYFHKGNALPLLIQEGKFNTVTLRRVRVEDTTVGVQIGVINEGHIKTVIIEDCPGLHVALMGRPGSIEKAIIRDSPDALVRDTRTPKGVSGARIITETTRAPAVARTRNAPAAADGPKDSPTLSATAGTGAVSLSIDGANGEDVAFIVFEIFDSFDYRLGSPVIVTERPFKAELKTSKTGSITCRATITRLGGAPDPPLVRQIEIPVP